MWDATKLSSWLTSSFLQVFEEEHHILYLDHGGVIVAIKDTSIPLKILKYDVREQMWGRGLGSEHECCAGDSEGMC